MGFVVHHDDCREVMASMDAESVDAVVCDPPYGLCFMGKGWDHGVPGFEFWAEAIRVAKPGAHLLAFGGTRTYHRLACAIEDAGWEIRDCVMWLYGQGFPKSHNLKGQWSGWGTALKPAWEPIIVARKPLCGTVAENVLRHGTGGINVDGCRIESGGTHGSAGSAGRGAGHEAHNKPGRKYGDGLGGIVSPPHAAGRWPANVIHDGSDEVVGLFPNVHGAGYATDGAHCAGKRVGERNAPGGFQYGGAAPRFGDTGSAACFFYCAKASKADRDEGCEGLPQTIKQSVAHGDKRHGTLPYTNEPREMKPRPRGNHHPTVKPTALMRYLCRLVTPPGGVVLDPFTGSGSTGKAAIMEGFRFIGVEREAEYVEIARARIAAVAADRPLLETTA